MISLRYGCNRDRRRIRCDPLFVWARQNGILSDAEIWKRIEAAAEAANPGTVSSIANLLDGADKAAAKRIADAVQRSRRRAGQGRSMDRHAAQSRCDLLWPAALRAPRQQRGGNAVDQPRKQVRLGPAQKNRILNAIAVYRSTSFEDDALARLKALPADAEDDTSREWRVRVALATQDWNETLAALDAMSDEQKADARWRYLRARVLSKLDRDAEAAPLFADVATRSQLPRLSRRRLDRRTVCDLSDRHRREQGRRSRGRRATGPGPCTRVPCLGRSDQGAPRMEFRLAEVDPGPAPPRRRHRLPERMVRSRDLPALLLAKTP